MSLGKTFRDMLAGSAQAAVQLLGRPASYIQTKPPNTQADITVGFRMAGKDDTEIVNAYGINARIITIDVNELGIRPEKFDTVVVNGERYTIDAVQEIAVNDRITLWKAISRGK